MGLSKDQKKKMVTDDMQSMGYEQLEKLGSGHFATVYLVKEKEGGQHPGRMAACKVIEKPKDIKKQLATKEEHRLLTEAVHPTIVQCYDAFETDVHMYLFLEPMEGGELFDYIVDKGHLSEHEAAKFTYQLLSALDFMHKKGIAHRDLKPENMLMTKKGEGAEVKITDFGLGKFYDEQSTLMKTPCGTPGYIAPEVLLMKGYDHKCDVWSLGVIVYILLCGFPPFYADNDALLFEKIKKGDYQFLKPYWDPISDGAKNIVKRMLVVDPKARPECADLLKDPWLADHAKETEKEGLDVAELKKSKEGLGKLKNSFLKAFSAVSLDTSS